MTDVATKGTPTEDGTIRPVQIEVPQEEIDELRRRVQATRWPERETVEDESQGVPLATMQELDDVIPSMPGYGFSGKPFGASHASSSQ